MSIKKLNKSNKKKINKGINLFDNDLLSEIFKFVSDKFIYKNITNNDVIISSHYKNITKYDKNYKFVGFLINKTEKTEIEEKKEIVEKADKYYYEDLLFEHNINSFYYLNIEKEYLVISKLKQDIAIPLKKKNCHWCGYGYCHIVGYKKYSGCWSRTNRGGGLMQLVAYGYTDAYMSQNYGRGIQLVAYGASDRYLVSGYGRKKKEEKKESKDVEKLEFFKFVHKHNKHENKLRNNKQKDKIKINNSNFKKNINIKNKQKMRTYSCSRKR